MDNQPPDLNVEIWDLAASIGYGEPFDFLSSPTGRARGAAIFGGAATGSIHGAATGSFHGAAATGSFQGGMAAGYVHGSPQAADKGLAPAAGARRVTSVGAPGHAAFVGALGHAAARHTASAGALGHSAAAGPGLPLPRKRGAGNKLADATGTTRRGPGPYKVPRRRSTVSDDGGSASAGAGTSAAGMAAYPAALAGAGTNTAGMAAFPAASAGSMPRSRSADFATAFPGAEDDFDAFPDLAAGLDGFPGSAPGLDAFPSASSSPAAFASEDFGTDKADWNSRNNRIFLELCVEQLRAGNASSGHMTSRGFNIIAEKYKVATGLNHNYQQLKNRFSTLRGVYTFWMYCCKASGLGWDNAKCTVVASESWWKAHTQKHSEWKKIKNGPPECLDLLETLSEKAVVDGASSCTPGEQHYEVDDGGDDDDDENGDDCSPMGISHGRGLQLVVHLVH